MQQKIMIMIRECWETTRCKQHLQLLELMNLTLTTMRSNLQTTE